MEEMMEVMRRAFMAYSSGRADAPQRTVVSVPERHGVVLVKPGRVEGRALGAKLVSIFPDNPRIGLPTTMGIVILLDPATGEPLAVCDGTFLTAWRTAATSGLATDLLARPDARNAAVLGAGAQARAQVLAIDAVRDLDKIRIFAPTAEHVDELVESLQPFTNATLISSGSADTAVSQADIVCAVTTSDKPVFGAFSLKDGTHINGVGSFRPSMKEIDSDVVRRAKIFVDSRQGCSHEAGELIDAIEQGWTSPNDWTEIGEVALGARSGRETEHELTFFKTVGIAVQDVEAAAAALIRCEQLGLGEMVEL